MLSNENVGLRKTPLCWLLEPQSSSQRRCSAFVAFVGLAYHFGVRFFLKNKGEGVEDAQTVFKRFYSFSSITYCICQIHPIQQGIEHWHFCGWRGAWWLWIVGQVGCGLCFCLPMTWYLRIYDDNQWQWQW